MSLSSAMSREAAAVVVVAVITVAVVGIVVVAVAAVAVAAVVVAVAVAVAVAAVAVAGGGGVVTIAVVKSRHARLCKLYPQHMSQVQMLARSEKVIMFCVYYNSGTGVITFSSAQADIHSAGIFSGI